MSQRAPADNISPVKIDLTELIALGDWLLPGSWQPNRQLAAQSGSYRSRFRGRGMEFAEVRAYLPGDDVRSIDWRVTARRGKVHTKMFHEERERPVIVALDYRRPMFFATRGRFKAVQASQLAALLAWQALSRGALGEPFGFAPSIALGALASLFLPPLWLLTIFACEERRLPVLTVRPVLALRAKRRSGRRRIVE